MNNTLAGKRFAGKVGNSYQAGGFTARRGLRARRPPRMRMKGRAGVMLGLRGNQPGKLESDSKPLADFRPPGPEAVRTAQKVLLLDRLQRHDDRPLENYVLQGRDSQVT